MEVVRRYMDIHGITRTELGRMAKVENSRIWRAFDRDNAPAPDLAHAVAKATGIPLAAIRPDLARMFGVPVPKLTDKDLKALPVKRARKVSPQLAEAAA